jgi:hypothetical protein
MHVAQFLFDVAYSVVVMYLLWRLLKLFLS